MVYGLDWKGPKDHQVPTLCDCQSDKALTQVAQRACAIYILWRFKTQRDSPGQQALADIA